MIFNKQVVWINPIPENNDVPKLSEYIRDSMIRMYNEIFIQVVYKTLGREFDESDIDKFKLEYVSGQYDKCAVLYLGEEIGTIDSTYTEDHKYIVQFNPKN